MLALVGASELLEGVTEETPLLVLALPVRELHCWYSRPRGGTVEGVFSMTTGRRATFHEDRRPIYTFPSGTLHWSARLGIAGRYNRGGFSSRTRFTWPRTPLLVLETKGLYVRSSLLHDDGGGGRPKEVLEIK